MKLTDKRKKAYIMAASAILLFVIAGTVFLLLRNSSGSRNKQSEKQKKEEMYFSLSASDRETADLYAELYELSREEVAEKQVRTKDWKKTAKELEKEFFTIPENKKYQM